MFLTNKQFVLAGVAVIALVLATGLTVDLQTTLAQEIETNTPINTTDTDSLLASVGTTITAVSALISTVVGIIVYFVNAIRSKTGDKIVSTDAYNKFLDVVGQVRQKDNELRDVYRQVLEQKETINVAMGIIKSNNPQIGSKLDETLPKVNETIVTKILPQIEQWQIQSDDFYDTLLKKGPVRS